MELLDFRPEILLHIAALLEPRDVLAFRGTCTRTARLLDATGWRHLARFSFGRAADEHRGPQVQFLREEMKAYFKLTSPLVWPDVVSSAWADDRRHYFRCPLHSQLPTPAAYLIVKDVLWLDISASFPAVRPGTYALELNIFNDGPAVALEISLSWDGAPAGGHLGTLNLPHHDSKRFREWSTWRNVRPCEPFVLPPVAGPAGAPGKARRVHFRIRNTASALKGGLIIDRLQLRRLPDERPAWLSGGELQ